MPARGTYERELHYLQDSVLLMGDQVLEGFHQALEAIYQKNERVLNRIIEKDKRINEQELAIHDKVTLMIAKQQPVATDLRTAIVALKISGDLERIGDLTVDIIKASKRMSASTPSSEMKKLEDMALLAGSMLKRALSAYKDKDLMTAQQIAVLDDKVDAKYKAFIRGLFALSIDQNDIENIAQLAFIGRYIERIADYATNLAEWIVYEQNGQHFDLN